MKRPTTEQLNRLALLLQLTANTTAHTPALEHLTHALDTLAIAATLAALAPEPNTPVDNEQQHDETDNDQNRDMPYPQLTTTHSPPKSPTGNNPRWGQRDTLD